MTINLSIRDYAITIAGLDCTRALTSFQGHDSNQDLSGLIIFTGSIALGRPQSFESLDDRKNNRWARGQEITLTIADKSGTLRPPPRGGKLFILDSQFDLKTRKLTLNVGDLFALLSFKEPRGDASKVCLGNVTTKTTVINRLLAAAGIAATLDQIPGVLMSATPRTIEGSYIEQAGAIAASEGYFLWVDSTGLVRASKIEPNVPIPLFAIDLVTGITLYDRLEGESPAERVSVNGRATIVRPTNDGTETIIEEFGPASIAGSASDAEILIKVTQVRDRFSRGSKKRTIETRVRQLAGIVLPDDPDYQGSTDLIDSEFTRETYQYELNAPISGLAGQTACQQGNQGRLKEHIVEIFRPRIVVFREIYATYPTNDAGQLEIDINKFEPVSAEKTRTTYVYDVGVFSAVLGDVSDLAIPLLEPLGSGPKITRTKTQPLGSIIPEDYAYDPDSTLSGMELPTASESEIQMWREKNYGDWEYQQTLYRSLAIAYPQVAETLRERKANEEITFDPAILARLVEVTGTLTRSNSGQAQPPAADTYPAAYSTQEVEIKGRANFPIDITSPYRPREKTLSFDYLSSATYGPGAIALVKAQADALAKIWGVIGWGRHKGSQLTTDLDDAWFDYQPMCRVDVNEMNGISANLADGFTIAIAGQRCVVNVDTILLGFTSAETPALINPPYRVSDDGDFASGSTIETLERLYSLVPTVDTSQLSSGSSIDTIEVIETIDGVIESGTLSGGSTLLSSELFGLLVSGNLSSGGSMVLTEIVPLYESGALAGGSSSFSESSLQLQPETSSWISRVQSLGGDATPDGVVAVESFFQAIKPATYWSKLKLLHLFAGTTTIASAMAPLKHPSDAAATSSGFGSGAYTNTGVGAGIQGDGYGYINHNYSLYANTPGSSAAIGTYSKTEGAYGGVDDVGLNAAFDSLFVISLRWADNNSYSVAYELPNAGIAIPSPGAVGFCILSRTSNSDVRYYLNGTQYGINTTTASSILPNLNAFYSFASGAGVNVSPRKLVFSFAAEGLTPTEVNHFTVAVNTLVAAI